MTLNIRLPFSGKSKLKVGDKVDFNTPLYEEKQTNEIKLALSDKLGVAPDKIFQYLKKLVGDEVKKGDILAQKKSLLDNKKVISDVDGVLKEINHNEGYILLDIENSETRIKKCFFKGEIGAIDKYEIKLKIANHKEYPLKEICNIAQEFSGYQVYYLTEKHGEFNEDDISGKIVVCSDIASYHQVKLEALGASGFIGLRELTDPTLLPFGKFKNLDDIKVATKAHLPYCIIDKKASKIIFYENN